MSTWLRALALSFVLGAPLWAAEPVHFADANLKAVVEQALWVTDPTAEDMLALGPSFAAEGEGIRDLTGLEYALNVEELWIRWNSISDLSPLSTLTKLQFLDGHGNQRISDVSPLAGLTELRTLVLRDNSIKSISALSGLTKLEHFHLEWNRISDISALSNMPNLETVWLQYNEISDISSLSGLTKLQSVDIRGNPLNEDSCTVYIPQILANNPDIDLEYNPCGQHTVVLSSTAGGHIVDPGEGEFTYDNGERLYLRAQARSGFMFVGFVGSFSTSENPTIVVVEQDLDIQARFACLERKIHVDDNGPYDPLPGDSGQSDPQENGTAEHPFDRIQEAIEVARSGAEIIVHAGTYRETIDPLGKRITVTGFDPNDPADSAWPVIDGAGKGPVAGFTHGEDPNCTLAGLVLTGGRSALAGAIRCSRSSPTIANCVITGNRGTDAVSAAVYCTDSNAVFVNCTIADNQAGTGGAALYLNNSCVSVVNSIVWGNAPRQIVSSGARAPVICYSAIDNGWPGPGNISSNPLFAAGGYWADQDNPAIVLAPEAFNAVWIMGDYHLQSQAGRWDPLTSDWVNDPVTSPCIDGGDPTLPVGLEPLPNGQIINMGAYGGTAQASRSAASVPVP